MAEVLSQNEIDALLSAVKDGKVQANEPSPEEVAGGLGSKKIELYDLTSQERIIRGKLVALKGIHERFANFYRMSLGSILKKNISVKILDTQFVKFGDYLSQLSRPLTMSLLECEELKATIVVTAKSSLTYALVDAYYGGSDRPYTKPGDREAFTEIENHILKKFITLAVGDLEQSWLLNYPLKLKYRRAEHNPFFVGSLQPQENVAIVSCQVDIEQLRGEMDLVVQLHPLDAIQDALSVNITGQIPGEEEAWKKHWMTELQEMEFHVKGILGQTEKTLKQIRQLKVGDVLVLGQDAVAPITLTVQDVPKYRAMIGVFRGNNAVRLT